MTKAPFKLIMEIVKLSEADNWIDAKKEWFLFEVTEEENHCACGHEIWENCLMKNKLNNNEIIVGNSCVNRFMDIETKKIFDPLKKIKKDLSKSVNLNLLDFCHQKDVITRGDYDFYIRIMRKRKLSTKVLDYKININTKIVLKLFKFEDVDREISSKLRYDILVSQNWKCKGCNRHLKYTSSSKYGDFVAHIDHIHPYSKRFNYKNGHLNINERENLQALCERCNLLKGDKNNSHLMAEIKKMSLRDNAKAYQPQAKTHNIADLQKVDIDSVELYDKIVKEGTPEEFKYKYILVNEDEYRVPLPVLGQLKTQLDANPNMKFFKVVKSGTGISTQYTVIPLME